MAEKQVRLPQFGRDATVRAGSFDQDANTVEIVWTTGASVRRYDYWDGTEYDEVLSLDPGAVRLDRLNLGAPFLDTHCSYGLDNVIGSVVPGSAKIEDGRGLATILLSKAPGVADTVQKIREGVIRNISVGYWIHKVEKADGEDGKIARWTVTDWEPLEISAVPIPADPGSQVRSEQRRDGKGPKLRACTLIIPDPPAAGPKSPATKETRMATRTKTAPKRAAKPAAEMTDDEKRMAKLRAAERAGDVGQRDADDDEDEKKSDDERDDDMDDARDADDDKTSEHEDADDQRDADDDADDERDADEDKDDKRAAPSKGGKRAAAVTAADVRKAAEAAVRADRIRGAEIRKIASQFGLPKLGERHANGETSVRTFKDLVLERLAKRQEQRGNTTFAAAGIRELDERSSGERAAAPGAKAREHDDAATTARRLLGKKAA